MAVVHRSRINRGGAMFERRTALHPAP